MFPVAFAAAGILGTLSGHVTIGPSCPGPEDAYNPCPDKPYAARVVARQAGKVVKRTTADARGVYRLRLRPGSYRITVGPVTATPIPAAVTVTRKIRTRHTTKYNVALDSGIR